MLLRKFRRWALIGIAVFVSAQALLITSPSTVQADGRDGSFISSELSGKVLDHQLYYYMASCFRSGGIDKIPKDELLDWRWLKQSRLAGTKQSRVRGAMYENNTVYCEDGQWLKEAFGRFGFTDPLDTFCSLGFAYNQSTGGLGNTVNGGDTKEACVNGLDAGDFDGSDGSNEKEYQGSGVDELLATSSKFAAAKAPLPAEAEYLRYYRTLMRGCGVTLTQPYTTGAARGVSKAYKIIVVNQDGSTEEWLGSGEQGDDVKVDLVSTLGEESNEITCGELSIGQQERAAAYADYLKREGTDDEPVDGNPTGNGDDEPVCTAGALGWVICPAINFLGEMNDAIYSVVRNMLYINPLTVEIDGPLYNTWTKFRDIANVLFVAFFLVVVFSQATSVGLSSYGIKKLLPRILAAAILVNISFFICQIALDLSNIAGVGVTSLVDSMRSTSEVDIDVLSWSTLIGAAIGGGAAIAGVGVVLAAGGVTAMLAMLLPFMVAALFAIVTAIAVLIARQVIIILLIALSPLAFVALILPNTQKYFQLWQNTLTTMLVMFPLVALLFAGSQLAANIVLTTSTTDDGINFFALLAAICMMFIPLFGIPYIVKFSGGTIGRLAGVINNPNKGPFDALRKKSEGYRDYKQNQAKIRNMEGGGNALQRNTFGRYTRRNARKDAIRTNVQHEASSSESSYLGETASRTDATGRRYREQMAGGAKYQGHNIDSAMRQVQAAGVARVNKELEERVSAASELQKLLSSDEKLHIATTGQTSSGARVSLEEQVAAARESIRTGNFEERQKVYESVTGASDGRLRKTISDGFFAAGDNAVLGAAYGGKLQLDTPGATPFAGSASTDTALLSQIKAGKIKADALVRDAHSTELVLKAARAAIASGELSSSSPEIESLRRVALEARTNANTSTTAASGAFKGHIDDIAGL